MTQDKWKVFAINQCFSNEMDDAECVKHFDTFEEFDYPDDIEKYLFDSDLIPWHPYEHMVAGDIVDHVLSMAAQAQCVEASTRESNINVTWLAGGWNVSTSEDAQYLYIERDGAPGLIHIKAEDEGFVVDLWDGNLENCMSSAAATYTELEPE